MLTNVVANLMNVLRMKQENDAWVANLHNIDVHCMCFLCLISASLCPMSLFSIKSVLFVHICPAFYGNVNTNASESLQMSYKHYKCIAYNKSGL